MNPYTSPFSQKAPPMMQPSGQQSSYNNSFHQNQQTPTQGVSASSNGYYQQPAQQSPYQAPVPQSPYQAPITQSPYQAPLVNKQNHPANSTFQQPSAINQQPMTSPYQSQTVNRQSAYQTQTVNNATNGQSTYQSQSIQSPYQPQSQSMQSLISLLKIAKLILDIIHNKQICHLN